MIFGVWCEKCQGKLQLLYGVLLNSSSRWYFLTFQGDSGNLDNKNLNFLFIVSADTVKNESMAWDVCLLTCRLQWLSFWTVKQSVLSSSPYEDSGSLEIMNLNSLVILSADSTVKNEAMTWEFFKYILLKWIDWYQFRSTSVFISQYLSKLPEEMVSSHCRDLPYSLWNWGNGGKFRRPLLYSQFMVLWVQVYNGNCRSLSLLSPRFLQQN